jgi:spermidine synthase
VTGAWLRETLYPDLAQTFRMQKVLFRDKTELQDLVIFENAVMGRVLALDGVIQTTERDEFVYHEMMVHVPVMAHGAARRVLIIGGGDGGCLREVLKHRAIEQAVLVEIDESVIALSRQWLPTLNAGAFDDPRARLVIADGARYVKETAGRFDVILVDSTDPHGPGAVLFTAEFYGDCKRCLNPGGVLVTQSGVPFLQPAELGEGVARLSRHFRDAACYVAAVPTYYGGVMALGWASDDAALRRLPIETLAERYRAAGIATRYYNPEVHRAAFALPGYVRDLLA